jgi:hypothetical protein
MDFLSITRVFWRHKVAALPVILLTLVGMYYVFGVKPPVYEASSSLLLVNPPTTSATQVVNNPLLNDGLETVADVITNVVDSTASQKALESEGVDPRYQAQLSTDFGDPPVIQITGVGTTAQAAIRASQLVSNAATNALMHMQATQHVTRANLIKAIPFAQATQAQLSLTSKLRSLIAVIGVGAILLLIVVSGAEALDRRRAARSAPPAPARSASISVMSVDEELAAMRPIRHDETAPMRAIVPDEAAPKKLVEPEAAVKTPVRVGRERKPIQAELKETHPINNGVGADE